MKGHSNADSSDIGSDGLLESDHAARLLGIVMEKAEVGSATASMQVTANMVNALGLCHGGFIFTLADTALAYASNSQQAATVSTNVTIDFIRPAMIGDRLLAVATRRHASRRNGLYHIEVTKGDGILVAVLSGRVVVVEKPSGS